LSQIMGSRTGFGHKSVSECSFSRTRRRSAPGRPQYVYALTERAADIFPNNYQGLATGLLQQLKATLTPGQVSEILEGVADSMAERVTIPDAPLDVRLEHVVAFLNTAGYAATAQPADGGHVLSITNCPYEQVTCSNPELCKMDERLIAARDLEEVSIGDYVLSGGEIGALAVLDACVRLLPGVMGKEASGAEESFAGGLLEYPQYTRPHVFEGRPIPDILVSGDHGKVAKWRREEAERLTRERRPDLWAAYDARQPSDKKNHPKR
jgi:hypothetical protein